jgi:hypothetical protein
MQLREWWIKRILQQLEEEAKEMKKATRTK